MSKHVKNERTKEMITNYRSVPEKDKTLSKENNQIDSLVVLVRSQMSKKFSNIFSIFKIFNLIWYPKIGVIF